MRRTSDLGTHMIRSFEDRRTRAVFDRETPKGLGHDLVRIGRRKLRMIAYATALDDLRTPPGNGLEALLRGRKGEHSIRINDQFRVCFRVDGRRRGGRRDHGLPR